MEDFFDLEEGPLGDPPAPVPVGKKRTARGSTMKSDASLQQLQQPAKGEQPLVLKLAARTTGRTCNCCGKEDKMNDPCQPQFRFLGPVCQG